MRKILIIGLLIFSSLNLFGARKQIIAAISSESYTFTTDSTVNIDLDALLTFESIHRITTYIFYDNVGGGNDGTIKINVSPFKKADVALGTVLAKTETTSTSSNQADGEATNIDVSARTIQVVYTANANTGTGDLHVIIVVDYE